MKRAAPRQIVAAALAPAITFASLLLVAALGNLQIVEARLQAGQAPATLRL